MKSKIKNTFINLFLLFGTILLIFISDRLLLWRLGLPIWEWDQELHYKLRKNISTYWDGDKSKPLLTNSYGFYDDEFPVKKKKKELRILNLGDSITMGHQVDKDSTYSSFMERILKKYQNQFEVVQVLNTGVQGYSTFQELEVLKRAKIFQPEIVTIGFCLNDVTEPFIVNTKLNGIGLDYHKVTQAQNKFLSYLLNETGYGRLIQEIRIRKLDAKQLKINELLDAKKMIQNRNDSTYIHQWDFTLNKLTAIYNVCKTQNYKPILLIFPFTFQLFRIDQQWPQEILISHANKNNIEVINFVKIFEDILKNSSNKLSDYFIDEDHLTPLGHKIVAEEISKKIMQLP